MGPSEFALPIEMRQVESLDTQNWEILNQEVIRGIERRDEGIARFLLLSESTTGIRHELIVAIEHIVDGRGVMSLLHDLLMLLANPSEPLAPMKRVHVHALISRDRLAALTLAPAMPPGYLQLPGLPASMPIAVEGRRQVGLDVAYFLNAASLSDSIASASSSPRPRQRSCEVSAVPMGRPCRLRSTWPSGWVCGHNA